MARPPQDPRIRIKEILDAAESLFYEHGYQQTMISDIVKRIGVAQGTFYYYFSSKEEIIEALINRNLLNISTEIDKTIYAKNITLSHKIELVVNSLFNALHHEKGLVLGYLYNDQSILLMDKLFRQAKKLLTPYLCDIIEEGNSKATFKDAQPKASLAFILAIIQCYIEAIYEKEPAEILTYKWTVAKELIENVLGIAKGSLDLATVPLVDGN
ncbi:MAG: transcriptional regulator, TetR family [Firmicutes bacterium]|nr:transcriptional regulator, TetR family [Bacillota bacterium]